MTQARNGNHDSDTQAHEQQRDDRGPGRSRWSVDKKLPIGLICTVIVQTMVLSWYASKIDSRIETLELQNATNARLIAVESNVSHLGNRQVELIQTLTLMNTRLSELNNILLTLRNPQLTSNERHSGAGERQDAD